MKNNILTNSAHSSFYGWAALRRLLLAIAVLTLWCRPLWAESLPSAAPVSEEMFDAPCLDLDIPKPLVMAIAKVESNLHPWTLNIEGRSFCFNSKEEALLKAREARDAGLSFDVGLMQINDWWLQKYGLPLEIAFEPLTNISIGGWILKQEFDRHGGDIRAAVGAYHSPNPTRAGRYAKLVFSVMKGDTLHQAALRSKPAVSKKMTPPSENPQPVPNPAAAMLIVSKHKTLAQSQSLKAPATALSNSMKVIYEN